MNPIIRSIVLLAIVESCAEKDKHGKILDTPTAGSITVTVDESLRPLIDAEIAAFEGIYHNAHITALYTSEEEAIQALVDDSARMTIVTRSLIEAEVKSLADQKIVSTQVKLATGGVALIANRQNPDSLIRLDELKEILSGDSDTWGLREKGSSSLPLQVVFDQPNSGIIRYLRDSLIKKDELPKNCFALKSNAAVVEYVLKQKRAMGLIDVSWISDRDDSTANSFLKSIRVMGVSTDSGFFQPYQAYIAQNKYPLRRDVLMISREARAGLASGFMAFIASDKGQRIVLKAGLVPATMPIRIIEVNHEPF